VVEEGAPSFEPLVLFHTFADSSINFTAVLCTKHFFHQPQLTSAFIKRLHKRYKKEGINIPFPIRTIQTLDEKKGKNSSIEEIGWFVRNTKLGL